MNLLHPFDGFDLAKVLGASLIEQQDPNYQKNDLVRNMIKVTLGQDPDISYRNSSVTLTRENRRYTANVQYYLVGSMNDVLEFRGSMGEI